LAARTIICDPPEALVKRLPLSSVDQPGGLPVIQGRLVSLTLGRRFDIEKHE
jgi:hypothetical protein